MATNEDRFICPECGSSNIVKLSLIYKRGISSGSNTGTISKGAFNSVDVDLDSDHQTMASELAEPPTGPIMTFLINLIIGFVLAIAGFLVLLITQLVMGYKAYEQVAVLLGIIYLLFVLFLVIKVIIINSYLYARKYPSLMNRWRNSYQCQRCDAEFILMG
jgi:DNA-directed RNA polymerase subunit RPC12/RpoP